MNSRLGDSAAYGLEDMSGQMSEDGQGFGFNLCADTKGFTQEDGGVGFTFLAFGENFGNEHAYYRYRYS